MKISVIIPVYKVEDYLERCVKSVINQRYKNLEIILVDDGSPDRCPEICDDLAKQDKRIKVIHKDNGGVSSARNAGLDIATGDFVTFLDSDDWFLDSFSDVCENLKEDDEYVITPGINFNLDYSKYQKLKFQKEENFHEWIINSSCAKLMSRKSIGDLRFLTGVIIGEDMEFSCKVLVECANVRFVDIAFYHYVNDRDGSAMNNTSAKYAQNSITSTAKIIENTRSYNLNKNIEETLVSYYSENLFGVFRFYSRSNKNERKELKKLIKGNIELFSYNKKKSKKMFYILLKLFGVGFTAGLLNLLRKLKVVK